MKYTLITFLTILTWSICTGQDFQIIKDTTNNFEIGVPVGWRYWLSPDNGLEFMAIRQKQDEQDIPRETFNINILHLDETDLDKSYQRFLKSVSETEGFKIIDEGNKIIKGRKYKYLIETHNNKISKEKMTDLVLFTNNNGDILILTMVTITDNFEKFKGLFDNIAISLSYY